MGIKTYNDIASMQNNPSTTGSTGATRGKPKTATGGRIKVAKGGRVRNQSGSVTSVRGRGGPNIRPNVNVLGVEAARAHQAVRRANPPRQAQRTTGQAEGIREQEAMRQAATVSPSVSAQMERSRAPRRPPPDDRPGYAKGSKAKSKKGKKSTKKAPKKSIFEQITRPGSPSRRAASKGGKAKR